jgi:hypothetical protein
MAPARAHPPDGVDVTVVLGPCDELRAEVYVRAAVPAGGRTGPLRMEGTLSGPHCRRAITLPVTARVVDRGSGPAPDAALGRVVLTEPSFWTPQVPGLYRLDVRLLAGPHEVAAVTRSVGLRRLGVRGRSFWLDGHRWVPRAVGGAVGPLAADVWRGAAAAAVLVDPAAAVLDRADEEGMAIIAVLPADAALAADRVADWSAHPSVALAVVPRPWPAAAAAALAAATRTRRGTLLLARAVDGAGPPPSEPGCDALVVELAAGAVPDASWRGTPAVPLVACRSDTPAVDVAAGRAACDRLQADLAAWGLAAGDARLPWDWAGYAILATGPAAAVGGDAAV